MENPFTTIQNGIDKRKARKNEEWLKKIDAQRASDPEVQRMIEQVRNDLFTNPEVGAETTVTFQGETVTVFVSRVDGDKVTISAKETPTPNN